ncbi:response regulator [Couchioplanes caeruleus]|nr:hypothetical protein [Couchioplanes caeruleus]
MLHHHADRWLMSFASNASDAVEILTARPCHVIISDHSLASARGTALPGGVIVRVAMLAGPTSLPDPAAPDDVHRFTATMQITAR